MVHPATLLAILAMALATYATRTLGYGLLAGRTVGPRWQAVLDAAPPCVLLAVIAPAFTSSRPADLAALAITAAAATRLPMVATVGVAIAATVVLRHLSGHA